ncbi:MAG: OmpA family protein, partial [Bacteroidota bacterium]
LTTRLDKLQSDFDASKTAQEAEIMKLKESNTSLSSDKAALDADLQKAKKEFDSQLTEVKSSVDDKQRQLDALRGEINSAFSEVETAVTATGARINEIENFLYLDLDDEINFRSGSNRVDPNDEETLNTLADMLKNNPNVAIIVEGHTDSRSINTDEYADNWDLSVSRATAVVRKLIDMGVNPEQLIASGRSEYMPVDDNESADGRKNNRRTEAIVVPNIGKLYRLSQGK